MALWQTFALTAVINQSQAKTRSDKQFDEKFTNIIWSFCKFNQGDPINDGFSCKTQKTEQNSLESITENPKLLNEADKGLSNVTS